MNIKHIRCLVKCALESLERKVGTFQSHSIAANDCLRNHILKCDQVDFSTSSTSLFLHLAILGITAHYWQYENRYAKQRRHSPFVPVC